MRKYWLITDRDIKPPAGISLTYQNSNFKLFAQQGDSRLFDMDGKKVMILVDGYVMPVMSVLNEYRNLYQEELIFRLFKKSGTDFINYVKGNFSIVIVEGNCFYAFNDHLGIRKIFYSRNHNFLLLTNNFNLAAGVVNFRSPAENPGSAVANLSPPAENPGLPVANLSPSAENIAIHSLLHHFVAGITFSKEIFFTEQATLLEYTSSSGLKIKKYWDINNLPNSAIKNWSEKDVVEYFREVILGYIGYFNPGNVCMTLTGGMDSRLILAILMSNNIKPGAYAYGNPRSGDVLIAGKISEIFGLDFKNHYREHPDSSWFNALCNEILEAGDSVTHFHRAFRLAGIKSEKADRPETDMIFGGFMGGEGIKGVHYDDLIITKFTKTYDPGSAYKKEFISGSLDKYFTEHSSLSYDYIIEFIDHLPWYGKDKKVNEFFLNFILNASNHLAQDINFYHLYFPLFINPYMDIDYLKFLFSSPFSMMNKDNTSSSQLKRLDIPRFHCTAIKSASKELAEIPFSSGFSPDDYLFSKYYYAFKRAFHKKFNKKYLPHFTYGGWYLQFVKSELDKTDPSVTSFFKLEQAKKELLSADPGKEERYWHRFTNIIMMNRMINFYNKPAGY